MSVALLMPVWCGCTEQDKERAQRHHDELVISINTGKNDLREKKQERGAVADANRKAGYAALQALLLLPNTTTEVCMLPWLLGFSARSKHNVPSLQSQTGGTDSITIMTDSVLMEGLQHVVFHAGHSETICRRRCVTVRSHWLMPRLTARRASVTEEHVRLSPI